MDRGANAINNLQERKNILIADIMTSYRDLVNQAASPADNSASTGQTAYSSMALETLMNNLISSAEDLLAMTRQIRELWVIGPLKAPPDLNAESEKVVRADAEQVLAMSQVIRSYPVNNILERAAQSGGGFSYERGEVGGPVIPTVRNAGMGAEGHAQAQKPVVPNPTGQQL